MTTDALLDERWHMASTDVGTDGRYMPSRAEEDLIRGLRALAARMVHEIEDGDDASALDDLEFEVLADIEERLKEFATTIEAAREVRRRAAA
ncbi:MAG: hypothetical protein V4515_01840 [Chloroflexota bacterium]